MNRRLYEIFTFDYVYKVLCHDCDYTSMVRNNVGFPNVMELVVVGSTLPN